MMKKISFLALAVMVFQQFAQAQDVFMTRHGQVSFFSKTSIENIDAVNSEVASALNVQTGEVGFSLLVKGFHFERALMEEHFNENYMESDKMPKATFKGKINNISAVTITKDGSYSITADGDLTVHGITKKVTIPGTIAVKGGQLQLLAKFKIAPADYNVKIPSLVADKIENPLNVSVDCKYEKK